MISWLIFLVLVVVVTLILNKIPSSGILVCLGASATSTLLFQLLAAIQLGHTDKFSLIAVAITFPLALIISSIEILVLRSRKKR